MAQYQRVVVVFVASPSDMKEEREKLEEIIAELNTTWSRQFAIRLDLVRWETHAFPGIGTDPQDVINNEMPDDTEIFIGLMWGKYGTPTSRAGSGTEEEFEAALARHRKHPASIRIMFYFKDAPLPPSQIDTDQLARVQNFKSSLGTKGTLYWSFTVLDEFERLIRMHLGRQIQHFHKHQDGSTPRKEAQAAGVNTDSEQIDELGLLDYLDIVESNSVSLTEIVERISKETQLVGQRMAERNNEFDAVSTTQRQHEIDRRRIRGLINKVAIDMTNYVARIKGELPLFDQRLNDGAKAAGQVALIMSEDVAANDRQQVATTLEHLSKLNSAIDYAHNAIASFRDSVLQLPRMTSNLNKAKREMANVLQVILDSMGSARGVMAETVLSLDSFMEEGEA